MAVRRESVILQMETDFPQEAAKAAAAIAMLNDRVKSLNKDAVESAKANKALSKSLADVEKASKQSSTSVASSSAKMKQGATSSAQANRDLAKSIDTVSTSARRGQADVNQFSGRLRLIGEAIAVLGPSAIPVGAIAVPAIAGLAAQMGVAALAGGTMVAAFQGVGDALKAVNTAGLEPTAENLEKARLAMSRISPEARSFVRQIRDMGPAFKELRDTAAGEMFPGFVKGLKEIESALPKVERIMAALGGEIGDIAADSGASLAGPRWAEFLDFLATDSASTLRDLASGVGNVTHAMAELWMAFDPLSDGFGNWLVDSTGKLDRWAQGLDQTQGFSDFLDYVAETGPQVAETFGAIANMLVQIVQAAAPLGGPVLKGLEAVADVIASIADSDLGTPIFTALAALTLYNRALQATAALSRTAFTGGAASGAGAAATATATRRQQLSAVRSDYATSRAIGNSAQARAQAPAGLFIAQAAASERLRTSLRGMGAEAGKAGALVGGLALMSTGAGDALNVTNTASLALMGTMAGPWGAAAGAATGAFVDLKMAGDKFGDTMDNINTSLKSGDFTSATSGIKSLRADIDDLNSTNGLVDFFSDAIKAQAGFLSGNLSMPSLLGGKVGLDKDRAAEMAAARRTGEMNRASVGRNAAAQAMLAAGRLEAQGFALTAAGAKSAAASVAEFKQSMLAATAAMGQQGSMDAYQTSLLDMRDALKANGQTLDGNTRAGLANRAGMRQMAATAQEFAGTMKSAERRTKFLDRARSDFVSMAKAAGMSAPAAGRLADSFGLIDQGAARAGLKVRNFSSAIRSLPKAVQTEIKQNGLERSRAAIVDLTRKYRLTPKDVRTLIREQGGRPTKAMVESIIAQAKRLDNSNPNPRISARDAASGVIASVGSRLSGLDGRTATTYVYTRHISVGSKAGTAANPTLNADGGSVPKTGMHYADRHHYLLADGEEVISNRYGQADRHRDLLKAINANRLADGGTSGAYYGRGGMGGYGGGSGGTSVLNLTGLTIRGTLQTEFGPADIEGMIVDALDGDARISGMVDRTASVGA